MQYVKTRDGDIPNPVCLEIDASVLFKSDSQFSNQVANREKAEIYDIKDLTKYMDLDVLWGRTDWKNPEIKLRRIAAKYGEIMIEDRISIKDIINIKDITGISHG